MIITKYLVKLYKKLGRDVDHLQQTETQEGQT